VKDPEEVHPTPTLRIFQPTLPAFAVEVAFLVAIPEEPALSETEQRICFCFLPLHLFFAFSAQNSRVKPQNHLNPCQTATSVWLISFTRSGILDIELKNKASSGHPPGLVTSVKREN
jgi:hypothetical protein